MPIYEYQCTGCFCRFELKQGFDDDSKMSCPWCGSDAKRVFYPVPIIFKGSGFYSTDSRRTNSYTSSPEVSSEKPKKDESEKGEKKK